MAFGSRRDLALDDQSSLGFAFAEVVPELTREFAGTLTWRSSTEAFIFEPRDGQTAVQHAFDATPFARIVEVDPCPRAGTTSLDSNVEPDCHVYLETAAQLVLTTQDGHLADSFDGQLQVFGGGTWEFAGTAAALNGSFQVVESPRGVKNCSVSLRLDGGDSASGSFGVVVSSGGGESGARTGAVAADWSSTFATE